MDLLCKCLQIPKINSFMKLLDSPHLLPGRVESTDRKIYSV